MNILIIEDEAKAAKELKEMLWNMNPAFKVTGILSSVQSAIEWFAENQPPQLIFSDIQLADGLSFEIFKTVKTCCPVIFITAFDAYAIRAFEVNGIDYLLKPVEEEKLIRSVRKFENMSAMMGAADLEIGHRLAALVKRLSPANRNSILVFRNEKIIPVKTRDIAFIHSAGGIVRVHTSKCQSLLLRETLDELEPQLDPAQFFRVNRQYIINRDALDVVEYYFNRRLLVRLNINTPDHIIVSKEKASLLLEWLERS